MKVVSRLSKASQGIAEPAEFEHDENCSLRAGVRVSEQNPGRLSPSVFLSEGRSEGIILILRTFNTANKIKPKRKSLTEGESNPTGTAQAARHPESYPTLAA